MTRHLYIHIPFCKNICTYCDFVRIKSSDYKLIKSYCLDIIKQIQYTSVKKQYKSIYIGGGTPNHIPNDILDYFLSVISQYIDTKNLYEFTIECNPEFLNEEQAYIFAKNKINRVSIGAQILNQKILRLLNRHHSIDDIKNSIMNCRKYNINNISLDFIYNLPFMKFVDIDKIINFIKEFEIPHISFYALELKENSILTKQNFQLNPDNDEEQFFYIKNRLKELGYIRYEVSNWGKTPNNFSIHNLAYWNSIPWKAIGNGAHGFEFQTIYKISQNKTGYHIELEKLSLTDYYFQILMMGLRLVNGIDLRDSKNYNAWNFFKDKLKNCTIVDQQLKCNDIDNLDDTLINLLN